MATIKHFIKMAKEDKELLLKDLCGRFPYSAKVFYEYVDDLDEKTYGYTLTLNTWCINELVAEKAIVKPYLRLMSSMTEEEKIDYQAFFNYDGVEYPDEYIDWLNKNMFDYRGLIEKGLAIEALEGMYNLKVR